jgi:hypothetical protein
MTTEKERKELLERFKPYHGNIPTYILNIQSQLDRIEDMLVKMRIRGKK